MYRAQDQDGNIALGYSAASADLFPSVRYTARMAGDAPGTMPGGEVSCHEGTGAQTASTTRAPAVEFSLIRSSLNAGRYNLPYIEHETGPSIGARFVIVLPLSRQWCTCAGYVL